jgi:RNA polymerase sigma-70 factor (ECF subfamily)
MLSVAESISIVSGSTKSGSHQGTSDETLIYAIADGDHRAMHVLYTRHNVRVHRFILRLTNNRSVAEDLVSEVFLDVWRKAGTFRARARASTWILAIARYKALSALRARFTEQAKDEMVASIADPADDIETRMDQRDRRAMIQTCLRQLSAAHREVIDLVYYHEKSVDEVAQIVGVPASTVKTRMFYARKRIEKLLVEAAGFDLSSLAVQ